MTWKEFGFGREAHDFADRFDQMAFIRIGQIGSAYRATYDQVAAYEYAFFGEVEHHMAWRVAWGVDDFDFEVSDGEFLAVIDEFIGLARGDDEREREHGGFGIAELGDVEAMHEDFGIGEGFGDFSVIGDVIEMAMGQPEANEVVISAFGFFEERLDGVVGGVEEDGLAGLVVGDEVAVGRGQAAVVG